jgi:hypothetical protein
MENYTNSEMTDMVLSYGNADGVALKAKALYRKISAFANISSCGKWYFSTEKCVEGPRAYATGVRHRTPNSRENPSTSTRQLEKKLVPQFVVY